MRRNVVTLERLHFAGTFRPAFLCLPTQSLKQGSEHLLIHEADSIPHFDNAD